MTAGIGAFKSSAMPTFERINDLREELVSLNSEFAPVDRLGDWRGQWQCDYANLICDNQYVTLQGPVQWSGKTMIGALYNCASLLEGHRGIVSFPTLRQGGRVIVDRTSTYMAALESRYPIERIKPDAQLEKNWSNGARLMALSTDESAIPGIQGYSFDWIMVDEGHEPIAREIMGPLFSRAEIALETGHGKLIVLGVGGAPDTKPELADGCIIEHVQTISMFNSLRFDTARVGDEYPPAANAFKRAREIHTPAHFDQYYDCKPLTQTQNVRLFPRLAISEDQQAASVEHRFTVDVAEGGPSRTICSHFVRSLLSDGMIHKSVEDELIIPHDVNDGILYYRQSRLIAEFIQRCQSPAGTPQLGIYGANLTIETNGPGKQLADTIARRYPFINLKRVHTNDQPRAFRKTGWIQSAMRDAYAGLLTVRHEAMRVDLRPLTFDTKIDDGWLKYIWPRNDRLSTIWLYYASDAKVTVA